MQWVLAVAFVLPSCSVSHEGTTRLDKEGDLVRQLYARLASSDVLLHCPLPEGTSAVEWRVNSTSGAVRKEAREGGILVLQNASLADEGEYTCQDPTTGRMLQRVRLHLGYPPEKPAVRCRSASYPSPIDCRWTLETETHLAPSFFSTYRQGMDGEVRECVQATAGAGSCSIADVQMFSIVPYLLNVTAANPLGSATNLVPFFISQIVQPDPPENLTVSPIPGERKKLLLKWDPPGSWLLPEYFPLKYQIRYTMDGSSNTKTTRPSEETSFTLTGLRPGATYHVQVAAKDFLDHGAYSAWSSPASGAPWVQEG